MIIKKAIIVRFALVSFLVGVLLGSFFTLAVVVFYTITLLTGVGLVLFWRSPRWRLYILSSLFLSVGWWRYQTSLPTITSNQVAFYVGQTVELTGVLCVQPEPLVDRTRLTVCVDSVGNQAVSGKTLLTLGLYPEFRYGDYVAVNCQLVSPPQFEDFAYDRYLALHDIYALCQRPRVTFLAAQYGDPVLSGLYRLRDYLAGLINRNLGEPHASLLVGMVLNLRRGIPADLNTALSRTGTTHLIAISGLNMTILITIVGRVLGVVGLRRQKIFWWTSAFLVFYLILIAFPASAVRAALMAWILLLASYVGRLAKPINAVLLSAVVMNVINPKIIRDDVGFQLSFLAVLGLMYLVPLIERWFARLPNILAVRDALVTSLAAQLATLPLIVFNFGSIAVLGPAANILIVPVSTYILIIGLAGLVIGALAPFLLPYVLWPVWLLLSYMVAVVNFFAGLPWTGFTI